METPATEEKISPYVLTRIGDFTVDVFLCDDGRLGITVDHARGELRSRDIFVEGPELIVSHDGPTE